MPLRIAKALCRASGIFGRKDKVLDLAAGRPDEILRECG